MEGKKKFSKEEEYKVILTTLKNPDGGYGGETFWANMIMKYGGQFFNGKTADSLRGKWRCIYKHVFIVHMISNSMTVILRRTRKSSKKN